jgi:predicted Zn-dependent protease with MMP-like domain
VYALSYEEFDQVVTEVVGGLPKEFRERIDNVEIVVADYPSRSMMRRVPRGRMLLGLYQGVPQKHRGAWYGMRPVMPDRITLFKKNIEAICSSREAVYHRIRKTLLHEIGHHFSMSDKDLRGIGW